MKKVLLQYLFWFCFIAGSTLFINSLKTEEQIVILNTNDTHSQIDPNDANASRNPNMGGVLRRDALIEQIRKENENVILVDAGDFVQGTPYFNFFKGDVEVQMMNRLGYDVAVLGNHEFDNGIDALEYILKQAEFPIIAANYDLTDSKLKQYVSPTVIINKGDIEIGFIGLASEPEGLISMKNFEGIKTIDPVKVVNEYAVKLKQQGCDYIIVLSHLGYNYDNDNSGDRMIALQTENVDLIIGGHSHTLLKNAVELKNKAGKTVRIIQAGSHGMRLGRVDLTFKD